MVPNPGAIVVGRSGKRYRLSREAGRGGVGVVFSATEIGSSQKFAAKFMHSDRFQISDVQKERFRNEVRLICDTGLSEYFVRGIESGEIDGVPFLIMEWMPGGTLAGRFEGGRSVEVHVVVRWIAQMLSGFKEMVIKGIVHRHIKPNNF